MVMMKYLRCVGANNVFKQSVSYERQSAVRMSRREGLAFFPVPGKVKPEENLER